MVRLTSNKKVQEMGMLELAHNSCYVGGGEARYRDCNLDISARDLARELMLGLADVDGSFPDDGDFDGWMADYLQCSMDSMEGLIALFYRNLWAMADLWERLKKYEDLEEQGKLLELPCAVGDTVYRVNKGAKESIIPMKVCEVGAVSLKVGGFVMQIMCRDGVGNGETYYLGVDFGKAVFSTEQEAEAALKEL